MNYNKNSIGAIIGIIAGILLTTFYGLTLMYPNLVQPHPERSMLESVTGTVEWVKATGKGGRTIRLKLNESNQYFVYHSIAGMTGTVKKTLEIPNRNVGLLVGKLNSHSSSFNEHSYQTVYEVKSNDESIRSYEQVKASYKSGFKNILWIGLCLLVFFVLILLSEISKQR